VRLSRRAFKVLSIILDALFVNVAFVSAFLIRFGGELPTFNFPAYVGLAPWITLLYLIAGYVYGLYDAEHAENPWGVARSAFSAVTLGTILTFAAAFIGGPEFAPFSRLAVVIAWLLAIVLLLGWRLLFLSISGISWPEQRVLVMGVDSLAVELATELSGRERWGFNVVGLIETVPSESCASPHIVGGFKVIGCAADTTRLVAEHDVHRIIVASPVAMRELVESLALADESRVRVDVVPELYEVFIGTVDGVVGDIPLMEITRADVPPYYAVVKRAVDIFGALIMIILLSPILLLAALAILVTMGWPVLFKQERMGQDLRPFNVLKFRTMVRDAEKTSGPVLASEHDPRVTTFGRFMRTFRVDELPQLVNIVRGDMSFVGPRPERAYFVERFVQEIPGYRERFRVKPGVTGLAQVSGGYATTPERKLKYDLIYMYHQNLAMDLQIVFETLRVVLTGRGAR